MYILSCHTFLLKIQCCNKIKGFIAIYYLLFLNYIGRYCSTFSIYHQLRMRYVGLCLLFYGTSLKRRKKYKHILYQLLLEISLQQMNNKKARRYFDYLDESVYIDSILKDKKVCYIGSAPSEKLNIKDFDYYIVNNVTLNIIRDWGYPVNKTIVFLNSNFAKTHACEVHKLVQSCALVLFKNLSEPSFKDAGRFLHTDYGSFGAQNVLYYLVKATPKSVFVAGVNGYTSKKPFTPGLKKYVLSEQHISNILRRHDAMLNHLLLIFFASQLNIIGSKDFLCLSKTSSVDYCAILDGLYAHLPAKRIKGYGF